MATINLKDLDTIKFNGNKIRELKINNQNVWEKNFGRSEPIFAIFNSQVLAENVLVKEMKQSLENYIGIPVYFYTYTDNNISVDSDSLDAFVFFEFSNIEIFTKFAREVIQSESSYFFFYKQNLNVDIPSTILDEFKSAGIPTGLIDFNSTDFNQKINHEVNSCFQNNEFDNCLILYSGEKDYFNEQISNFISNNFSGNVTGIQTTSGAGDAMQEFLKQYYEPCFIICEADMLYDVIESLEAAGKSPSDYCIICVGKSDYASEMLSQNEIECIICEDLDKFGEFINEAKNDLDAGGEINVEGVTNKITDQGLAEYLLPFKVINA